jgi:hypothetical protein
MQPAQGTILLLHAIGFLMDRGSNRIESYWPRTPVPGKTRPHESSAPSNGEPASAGIHPGAGFSDRTVRASKGQFNKDTVVLEISGTVAETGVEVGAKPVPRVGEASCAATARQPKSAAQPTRISENRIRPLALPDAKDRSAKRLFDCRDRGLVRQDSHSPRAGVRARGTG